MKMNRQLKSMCFVGVLMVALASCGGNKAETKEAKSDSEGATTEAVKDIDTDLDKFLGLYTADNNIGSYSVGKFPANSKMKPTNTPDYFSLDNSTIGKYFIAPDRFSFETTKVVEFAGGYIAPPQGNIITGVDKNGGAIQIQNYMSLIKKDGSFDVGLGGTGDAGKFILRSDGKYDLQINGALYKFIKANEEINEAPPEQVD